MTWPPSTTLISCWGAEKKLCLQYTFGRSTNWTRSFVETNLARVAGFEVNLYLVLVLSHSLNHQYIGNSWSAAVGSHEISKLSKTKKLSIAKVTTSFDSFFRVEKMYQWCRLLVFLQSACGHQKWLAEHQAHQKLQRSETIFVYLKSPTVLKIGYYRKISPAKFNS